MPGPVISALLQPYSYETFYRLAHAYSEDVLSSAAAVSMSAALACKLLAHLPPVPSVEREFHSFRDAGLTLQETLRAAFWPRVPLKMLSDGETLYVPVEIINRERWSPYDDAAWDQFLAALITEARPLVSALRERLPRLTLPPKWTESAGVDPLQVEFLNHLPPELALRLDAVERWLDPAALETVYQGRRQTGHR